MKFLTDWKFIIPLVVATASAFIPVWLWQADLNSKSLSIKVVTKVSMQPKEQEAMPGLIITADGTRLENPHIVVFEVSNDGSKPILSTDFESPLDIRLESDTKFVRARITTKLPNDIDTNILSEKTHISLKPALFNPQDSVSFTAITSGEAPSFSTKARIIGIPNISIEDSTVRKTNISKLIVLVLTTILLTISALVAMDGMSNAKGIFLRRRTSAVIAFTSIFPAVIAFQVFLNEIGASGFWTFMLYYTILLIPTSVIAFALNRQENNERNTRNLIA